MCGVIVDGLQAGRWVRIPPRARNSSHHHRVQTDPASYPLVTRGSFPGLKWRGREADHSPPSSAEVLTFGKYRVRVSTKLPTVLCEVFSWVSSFSRRMSAFRYATTISFQIAATSFPFHSTLYNLSISISVVKNAGIIQCGSFTGKADSLRYFPLPLN
jgi:hypothetical protein